jgi:HTH-type transcriptional regulator, sugar sensing transcriptional regulator
MVDPAQLLVELGFAESEAKAYLTLLEQGPLTGYELAKVSGIPRGNVYKVLEKMELRGAAMRLEGDGSTRYVAVSPEEVLPRLAEAVQRTAERARALLQSVPRPPEASQVWNLRGYQALMDGARSLIRSARESLTIAICREEAPVLAADMRAAKERGIEIDTLCLTGCSEECGGCQGRISRHAVAPPDAGRWLVVVPDAHEVLAGEIPVVPEGGTTAIRTRQSLVVNLAAGYVQRSMVLAEMAEAIEAGEVADDVRAAMGDPRDPMR